MENHVFVNSDETKSDSSGSVCDGKHRDSVHSDRCMVRVTFDNGNSLTTDINLTPELARQYYIGKAFNLGDGCDGDLMATAVEVEVLS